MDGSLIFSAGYIETLRVVVSLLQLIVTAFVGFAAVQFYRWQRNSKEKEGFTGLVSRYLAINQMVIDNPYIQDIERKGHFVAPDLSREEIVKMFYYFEHLNSMESMLKLKRGELVIPESDKGNSHVSVVRNIGRLLYSDREFIRTHCLPRGYTQKFIVFLDDLWEGIAKELDA